MGTGGTMAMNHQNEELNSYFSNFGTGLRFPLKPRRLPRRVAESDSFGDESPALWRFLYNQNF
jgi:hypothetical protein